MDGAPQPVLKPKVGKNIARFVAVLAAIILLVVSMLAFAVAKTGIVTVPLFSRWYHGPTPTRLVSATPLTADAFRVLLGSRFFSQAVERKPPPYAVRVTEKELTGAIMTTIDAALRDGAWRQVHTQMVIRPTDLEFFSRFERGSVRMDVLVHFVPVIQDGELRFDPVSVRIGDYPLPAALAYRAASAVFARDLGAWTVSFGDARLESIRLLDGEAEIVATVRGGTP